MNKPLDDDFDENKIYSFNELKARLGKELSYVFYKNKHVTAIILRKDMNPSVDNVPLGATIYALVAQGTIRETIIKRLAENSTLYPVFVKESINHWKYIGKFFRGKSISPDHPDFKSHIKDATVMLAEIACVLPLTKSKTNPLLETLKNAS